MVNMGELFAHRRIGDIEMERVPLNERRPERDLLAPGDLLFARQSLIAEGAGKVSFFLGASEPVTFESHLIRARIDQGVADPEWIFYLFESPIGRERMRSIMSQVAAAGIRGSDLRALTIPCADLEVQHAVAASLRALDDKIDSNLRLVAILDEVAEARFRHQFGDVWADSGGGASFDALCEVLSGGTPRTTEARYWGGDIPWISVRDLQPGPFVLSTERTITAEALAETRLRTYPRETVVISARGTVGHVALMGGEMSFNQSCFGLRGRDGIGQATVLQLARSAVELLRARAHGSVFSTITRSTFASLRASIPERDLVHAYEQEAAPMYEAIHGLTREAASLRRVRDELLPKLVSGEVRVPDSTDPGETIEPLVEERAS
jgi:type I restriction enzyme S subunit